MGLPLHPNNQADKVCRTYYNLLMKNNQAIAGPMTHMCRSHLLWFF